MDKNINSDSKTVESVDVQKIWPRALFWVVFIWLALGATAYVQTFAEPGPFGDMFGVANSLFAGLAFAGIILSLLLQNNQLELQREELRLQRLELRDTRGVLEGQQKEMALQAATLKQQAADANFFKLLEMFRLMASELEDRRNEKGGNFWPSTYRRCVVALQSMNVTQQSFDAKWRELFYSGYEGNLAPYFYSLAELLDLIETENTHSIRYARILRAQLGPYETTIIMCHGVTVWGCEHLKTRIEKYGLLTNMPIPANQGLAVVKAWYDPGAFVRQGAAS